MDFWHLWVQQSSGHILMHQCSSKEPIAEAWQWVIQICWTTNCGVRPLLSNKQAESFLIYGRAIYYLDSMIMLLKFFKFFVSQTSSIVLAALRERESEIIGFCQIFSGFTIGWKGLFICFKSVNDFQPHFLVFKAIHAFRFMGNRRDAKKCMRILQKAPRIGLPDQIVQNRLIANFRSTSSQMLKNDHWIQCQLTFHTSASKVSIN